MSTPSRLKATATRRWSKQYGFDGVAVPSGRRREFPEIDRGEWFGLEEASLKIGKGQTTLIDQLRVLIGETPGPR